MDYALLIVIGLAFVLARAFEVHTEQARKTDERTDGNYVIRQWRGRPL